MMLRMFPSDIFLILSSSLSLTSLLCLLLVCVSSASSTSSRLHVLTALVSSKDGAGMDGGFLGLLTVGGGSFELTLINKLNQSCSTGELNTLDDNWEQGELNFFVGSQLHDCNAFVIEDDVLSFVLRHRGVDGGQLVELRLGQSAIESTHVCPVQIKLDQDQELRGQCFKHVQPESSNGKCNGHHSFCSMAVNRFTFAGGHNAGTGQSHRQPACLLRNQDLNIVEQLQFGLRFFDLDVIFKEGGGCHGLETGHGKHPNLGLYSCFGLLDQIFASVKEWLEKNEREVIVLFFGEIKAQQQAIPDLRRVLRKHFKLNSDFKRRGVWPTLAEAIKRDERIFVFMDSNLIDEIHDQDAPFVKVSKVSNDQDRNISVNNKVANVVSTFKSGSIGKECSNVVINAASRCAQALPGDFIKLAIFGTFSLRRPSCLWDQARVCNKRTIDIIESCTNSINRTDITANFIHADYPNYPANGETSLVQVAFDLNLKRASHSIAFQTLQ